MALAKKPRPTRKAPATDANELTPTMRDILTITQKRALMDTLKGEVDALQESVVRDMKKGRKRQIIVTDGGKKTTCTLVEGESVRMDEDALAKKIGATTFNKLTKRVLDSSKLEEAVKTGTVDPVDIAAVSTITARKPFVKLTTK